MVSINFKKLENLVKETEECTLETEDECIRRCMEQTGMEQERFEEFKNGFFILERIMAAEKYSEVEDISLENLFSAMECAPIFCEMYGNGKNSASEVFNEISENLWKFKTPQRKRLL